MIERRAFLAGSLAILAAPPGSGAQPAGSVHRIGFLAATSEQDAAPFLAVFQQALRRLGYADGPRALIEPRYAGGKLERLAALADELVKLGVEVIVTNTNPSTAAAQQATATVPIVMTVANDPVNTGFVGSLARPGGNITGLTFNITPQTTAKRLQLLKEAVPAVTRVAIILNPASPAVELYREAIETAARNLNVSGLFIDVRRAEDVDGALTSVSRGGANALFVFADAVMYRHRHHIADFAVKNRLPSSHTIREFVEAGGLMSYGADLFDLYRRAATYVDRILKGAKPADLPVEQPTKCELVVNLKTAKTLGLTIPQSVLLRADEVIHP